MLHYRYVLMTVAEPLDPSVIDQTLDICRRLKSEVHSYIKSTKSRSEGSSESYSKSEHGWKFYTSQNNYLSPRATFNERCALTPCLQDLYDKIETVLTNKKYGQEIHQNMGAAIRSRLSSLMVGNKGLMLNTRRSVPLENLFANPTVIELQNLGDDEEKAFVMALLLVLLYEYAEVRQRNLPPNFSGKLQHLTLVEKAHRLLQAAPGFSSPEVRNPRGKAVAMFTDMLAEMRAYGEGFIIADQIPNKLAPEILKNSNIKIVHRLAAPDDREVTGSCINLNSRQIRNLNNLAPGFAVIHFIIDSSMMKINAISITKVTKTIGDVLQSINSQKIIELQSQNFLAPLMNCYK
ncbi:hypothetical protein NIES4071_07850 [Calothrix sp. NIES-4071]|nr:hypothetical protein NIES4071_07850 [Calothrix sp. NIES-4071]BAZ55127.1 hypothetical protein NIES4105_07810 [Calothrix sp. NIES-4105]